MLTDLSIRDYAIVQRLDIELHTGMTCVTGETGAGKSAFVRLLGQDVPLEIEYSQTQEIESLYRQKFQRVFGYFPSGRELEVHSLRLLVAGASPALEEESFPEGSLREHAGALCREEIEPGERMAGPCLVADPNTSAAPRLEPLWPQAMPHGPTMYLLIYLSS